MNDNLQNIMLLLQGILHSSVLEVAKQNKVVLNEQEERCLENAKITFPPSNFSNDADLASNIAMLSASFLNIKPIDIAERVKNILLKNKNIEYATIAKPAFLNIKLSEQCLVNGFLFVANGLHKNYLKNIGKGEKINLEYVSANPTGPLHIGHVRGAIYGSALGNLLSGVGFDITREYYVNDAGKQIEVLVKSAYLRYEQAVKNLDSIEIPKSCYPGEYLVPIGKLIAEQYKDSLLNKEESQVQQEIKSIVVEEIMKLVKFSLIALQTKHDVFTSEKSIINSGDMQEAINLLKKKNLIYTGKLEKPKGTDSTNWVSEENQQIFKSTLFGDSSDRALIREDGSFSYFAPDIGYHYNKYRRGFNKMILIVGADHKGYAPRISAAVSAFSENKASIQVKLCELVNFIENGEKIKNSKRSGKFLTADDILKELESDVLRFIILSRKNDTVLDFDLNIAKKNSRENPVFYTKYAYSRCCSLLRGYKEVFGEEFSQNTSIKKEEIKRLINNKKVRKITLICNSYPLLVSQVVKTLEIHSLVNYMCDLSKEFHSLWGEAGKESLRFINKNNKEESAANMSFVLSVKTILSSCAEIIGVKMPESM